MEEPEVHPFSSNFRSQLSDVLSRPTRGRKNPDDKEYLETEIDLYSGVEFKNTADSTRRPMSPPKPIQRTFTFDKTNPFSNKTEASTLSQPTYAEVKKPKNKPKVPPKPQIRSKDTNSTLPHTQKLPDEQTKISKEDYFFRVNSLPNLAPEINHKINRASGNFLVVDSGNLATPGYGQLNKMRQPADSDSSVYHMTHDADYCDVIPETPSNFNDKGTSENDSRYENIYEAVTCKQILRELLLQTSERQDGNESDYTLMCSPVSEINSKFSRKSVYENVSMMHSPNSDVFQPEYENVGSSLSMGDPNKVGIPEQVDRPHVLSLSKDHVSPTSSYDDHDSSVYSVQSSMPSTAASSFQRVQVCFFPPSPPADFYSEKERPGSATSGSSTRSRSSRSRIPVPITLKKDQVKTPDVPDQSLPPTPTPSPAVRSKSRSKPAKPIELSPPSPPGNEMTPYTGKALGNSGKGAKWYEKLGCIQTDTIRPSEPYGRPGERKRSKSLNREQQRKSQFFLPVEPNESNPPNVQQT